MGQSVGIWSVGVYLPDEVRRNDWWPNVVVDQWHHATTAKVFRERGTDELPTVPGSVVVLQAIEAAKSDPFQGVRERRIAPEGMTSLDLEEAAATQAIARAGIPHSDIDLLFSFSMVPDHLGVSNSPMLHHRLNLRERCFATDIVGVCNSFSIQLRIATEFIRNGQARFALLVQSNLHSRLSPMESPTSAWFGDGATATILGPVAEGKGLLGGAYFTDGSFGKTFEFGIPGRRWYENGPIGVDADLRSSRRMVLNIPAWAKRSIDAALLEARVEHSDVDFYACHQATPWMRSVTQAYAGLNRARFIDSFPWAGSLAPSNIPFQLATAEREGLLRDGDIAAFFAGGSGISYSGTVLRWGS